MPPMDATTAETSTNANFNVKAAFAQGIDALLRTWPALRLALENDPDSSTDAAQKRQNLAEEIIDYFDQHGQNIESEDMADFYGAFFQDVFELVVDDGSVEAMASRTCALFRTLLQRDTRVLQELLDLSARFANAGIQSQVVVDNCEVDASDVDTEDDTAAGVATQQSSHAVVNRQLRQQPVQPAVEIDEDGLEWTPVVRRNRRAQQPAPSQSAQPDASSSDPNAMTE